MIDQELICKLNQVLTQHPASVTRLYSTVAHNIQVGGAPASKHLTGEAVDLVCDAVAEMIPLALTARREGFLGIEVDLRNSHVHLDMRKVKWEVVYTTDKKYTLDEFLLLTEYQI